MAYLLRANYRFSTTLYQAITDTTSTTIYPNAVPSNVPCVLIIDPKTATEEKVKVTATATNSCTVVRGFGGTTAQSHNLGAAVVDYNVPEVLNTLADAYELSFDASGNPLSSSIVTPTGTQTLTNKTLTKPTINGSVRGVTAVTGTTPTLDCSATSVFTITLTGNTTFSISNATAGQFFIVEAKQGSGTSYTTTWFSGITWVTFGAAAPVQTTTSNGMTTYGFRCTGSGAYLGYLVGAS